MNEPRVRHAAEIQAAHDRLVAILTGEVPFPVRDHMAVKAAADVLCVQPGDLEKALSLVLGVSQDDV